MGYPYSRANAGSHHSSAAYNSGVTKNRQSVGEHSPIGGGYEHSKRSGVYAPVPAYAKKAGADYDNVMGRAS